MALIDQNMLALNARTALTVSHVPVGTIVAFIGIDIPLDWLLCDGQSVLCTDYPELFAAISTVYGAVDAQHFNLPDLTHGQFLEGATEAGAVHQPGLPNITGNFISNYPDYKFGAFYSGQAYNTKINASSGQISQYATYIDASRCSTIYGTSNTVQPYALTVRYIVKARTSPADCTPLANKRNLITESGVYTAPVTAWYTVTLKGGGGGGGGGVYNGTQMHGGFGGGEGGLSTVNVFMHVGDQAQIIIGAGGQGGAAGTFTNGQPGGDTSVTVADTTYTAGGGGAGSTCHGGTGYTPGIPGGTYISVSTNFSSLGNSGGGHGGGTVFVPNASTNSGAGGAGGCVHLGVSGYTTPGGNGGDGYVVFEYVDVTAL